MEFVHPPPELVSFGLRALKTVALADGDFGADERRLMAAAQAMFGTNVDVDALEPIEPSELAARIESPALRRPLVRAMIVLSTADSEVDPREAAGTRGRS